MSKKLFEFDNKLRKQKNIKIICGIDEVARGCWAGPIVAAAVILKDDYFIQGLNDSKKLNSKTRKSIEDDIKNNCISWGIAEIPPEKIDKHGMTWANSKVMVDAATNAVNKINLNLEDVELFIIDQSPCKTLNPQYMLSKGDATSASVAAASILAKNYRDNLIEEISILYPNYNFSNHNGYINKEHVDLVNKYGLIDGIHRTSFVVSGFNKPKQINMMDFFDENSDA